MSKRYNYWTGLSDELAPNCNDQLSKAIAEIERLRDSELALKRELLAMIVERNEWMEEEATDGPLNWSEDRIHQLKQEIQESGS